MQSNSFLHYDSYQAVLGCSADLMADSFLVGPKLVVVA